mgnify:CR=1 FL=1
MSKLGLPSLPSFANLILSALITGYILSFETPNHLFINLALSFAALFEIAKSINLAKESGNNKKANVLGATLVHLSEPLGILQQNVEDYFRLGATLSNEEIQSMIDQRNKARDDKDFELSDKIRDSLLEQGIVLEDTDKGTIWKVR